MRISNSRIGTLTCPKKFLLKEEWNIKEEEKNDNLIVGKAYHAGVEEFNLRNKEEEAIIKAFQEIPQDRENRNQLMETIYACLEAFFAFNKAYPQDIISAETKYEIPFLDTETIFSGVKDALIEKEGSLWVKEYKTSSRSPEIFFKKYDLDRQAMGYIWAATYLYGKHVMGVCVEACFKPTSKKKAYIERRYFTYSEHKMNEWVRSIVRIIESVKRIKEEGEYMTYECQEQYGYCEFWDFCINDDNYAVLESTHCRKEERK